MYKGKCTRGRIPLHHAPASRHPHAINQRHVTGARPRRARSDGMQNYNSQEQENLALNPYPCNGQDEALSMPPPSVRSPSPSAQSAPSQSPEMVGSHLRWWEVSPIQSRHRKSLPEDPHNNEEWPCNSRTDGAVDDMRRRRRRRQMIRKAQRSEGGWTAANSRPRRWRRHGYAPM